MDRSRQGNRPGPGRLLTGAVGAAMKTLLLLALAACQMAVPVAPQAAEDSTFKMYAAGSQGTAWAITDRYLITAGHMCNEADKYALISNRGERFGATLVDYADNYPEGDVAKDLPEDVCLIKSNRTLSVHLTLAPALPRVGEQIYFVGYPLGEWTKSFGVYQGDLDDQHWNDYSFSAPCDHGASGSAVISVHGVWGVLVRVKVVDGKVRPGEEGCVAEPLSSIRGLLRNNGL